MTHPAPDADTEARVQRAVDEVLDESGPPGAERPGAPPMRVSEQAAGAAEPVEPWADKLVRFLDDGVRVPGTELRFGLDAIVGFFFPGVGDMMTGAGSLSLLFLAIKHRVPTVVIGRMVLNIALDTLLGSVPLVGDAFDLLWKSNRKNLELIERYRDDPEARPSAADYLLVGGAVLLVAISVLLPFLIAVAIAGGLASLFD